MGSRMDPELPDSASFTFVFTVVIRVLDCKPNAIEKSPRKAIGQCNSYRFTAAYFEL